MSADTGRFRKIAGQRDLMSARHVFDPEAAVPDDFLFGVCNSPYHSEGGYNTPGGPHNNWSEWEQRGIIEPSCGANRFWDRWQDHIRKAQEIGLNTFRMGFEWSRLQPSMSPYEGAEPDWDESAFDRYAEIVGSIYAASMEPCITLHHFTHPAWIGPWLWTDEEKVDKFLGYIRRAVSGINRRLAASGYPAIRHYVVINEPYNTLAGPYLFGDAPPGTSKMDIAGFGKATMNLLAAYVKAYDIIYEVHEAERWREPHVAFNIVSYSLYEQDKWYFDLVRAPSLGVKREDVPPYLREMRRKYYDFLQPVALAHLTAKQVAYWNDIAAEYEKMYATFPLDSVLDALYQSPRAKKLDYIAIDCYDPFVFVTLGLESAEQSAGAESAIGGDRFDWTKLKFNPIVTREHLRMHGMDLPAEMPLYVQETTIGHNHQKFSIPEPRPDGLTVEKFLKRMLWECVRLIQEGIPLKGFFYWTLCDNYEWGTYASRLGLVEYDYRNDVIKDTDAFGAPNLRIYGDLIMAMRSNSMERRLGAFHGMH